MKKRNDSCQVVDEILALLNAKDGDTVTFGGKEVVVRVIDNKKFASTTKPKKKSKKKYPSLPCFKGIATEKSSYKLTTTLLKELVANGKETGQVPVLEIRMKDIDDNCYYKVECKVSKE